MVEFTEIIRGNAWQCKKKSTLQIRTKIRHLSGNKLTKKMHELLLYTHIESGQGGHAFTNTICEKEFEESYRFDDFHENE